MVSKTGSLNDGDIRLIFARAWKPQLIPCTLESRNEWSAWNRQLENALVPYGFTWDTLTTWKADTAVKPEHEYMLWTAISSTVGKDAELTLRSVTNDDKRGFRAYHELARRYDRKSRIIREALEEQWENIQLRDYKDVEELIVNVQATRTKLFDQGVRKQDSDHARILRKAVRGHTEFEKLLNHDILHSDESSPLEDLTHLTNVLINTGTLNVKSTQGQRNERTDSATAFAAEQERSANPGRGEHAPPDGWALVQTNKFTPARRGRPGRRIDLFRKPDGSHVRTMHCVVCGGFGHWASTCPSVPHSADGTAMSTSHTQRNRGGRAAEANVASETEEDNVNAEAESFLATGTNTGKHTSHIWALDSCATHHMCGEKVQLENVSNHTTRVRGVGGTVVSSSRGVARVCDLTVPNVLRIHGLQRNLLSIPRRCAEANETYLFSRQGAYVMTHSSCLCNASDMVVRFKSITPLTQHDNGLYTLPAHHAVEANVAHETSETVTDTHIHHHTANDDESESEHMEQPQQHQSHGRRQSQQHMREDELWHLRSAHLTTLDRVHGHPLRNDVTCDSCMRYKTTRRTHNGTLDAAPGTYYCDLWFAGSVSFHNERYAMIITHALTGYHTTYFLRSKDEATKYAKLFIDTSSSSSWPLRILRCDNESAVALGAHQQHKRFIPTAADTPECNAYAERPWRTLKTAMATMLDYAGLPGVFWAYAFRHATHVINCGVSGTRQVSAYEAYHQDRAPIHRLRIFGCPAYASRPRSTMRKGQPPTETGIYVGFDPNASGFLVLVHGSRSPIRRDAVRFDEEWRHPQHRRLVGSNVPNAHDTDTRDIDNEHRSNPLRTTSQPADNDNNNENTRGEGTHTQEASDTPIPPDVSSPLPSTNQPISPPSSYPPPPSYTDDAAIPTAELPRDEHAENNGARRSSRMTTRIASATAEQLIRALHPEALTGLIIRKTFNNDKTYTGVIESVVPYGDITTDGTDGAPSAGQFWRVYYDDDGQTEDMHENELITLCSRHLPSINALRQRAVHARIDLNSRGPEQRRITNDADVAASAYTAILLDEQEHDVPQTDLEPKTIRAALASSVAKSWIDAYTNEITGLEAHTFGDLTDVSAIPTGATVVTSKMVHKLKRNEHGKVVRYKARLTARGDLLDEEFDYSETFSPTVRMESLRTLFAMATLTDRKVYGFDVEKAYLEGTLDEIIYMKLPPNLVDIMPKYKDKAIRLQRAIYGLPQSGRQWYRRFTSFITAHGYQQSLSDPCLYHNTSRDIWIALYVDDGAVFTTSKDEYDNLCTMLSEEFTVTRLGLISYSLGLQFEWTTSGVRIHQATYVQTILDRYSTTTRSTEMPALPSSLSPDSLNVPQREPVDAKAYRAAVGALMFVCNATRPDIATAVNRVARYMQAPLRGHLEAVERIFSYLRKTISRGIAYDKRGNDMPIAYTDSNLGGDSHHERSRGGHVVTLAGGPVLWTSKLQASVATSSCEAEYIQASEAMKDILFIRNMIHEIMPDWIISPTTLYCDNTAAISIVRNPQASKRTRHVQLRFQALREAVENKQVKIEYVSSDLNTADVLTKPLLVTLHARHMNTLTSTGGVDDRRFNRPV